jgi:hypothetical protein
MEDQANEATEPEETTESAAESSDAMEQRPNRFLVGLGWTVGRGARAVAGGAKWVGRGLQGPKPERDEARPVEDPAEDEVQAESEEETEEPTKKSKKKSKSE